MLKITTIAVISHTSKEMLKIIQAMLPQYVNQELPDVQAGFRKGRGTRGQIANICWIIESQGIPEKDIYFCFTDDVKPFDHVDNNKLWKILKEMRIPDHLTYLPRNPYAGHETCTASVFPLKCASNIRISQRHEVRIMPLVGELVLWNITWSPHFRQLLPVSSNKFRSELQGMKIRCPSLEAVSRQSQHLAVNLPNCLTVLKPSMTFQGHLYQPAVALQSPSRVQLFVTPRTVACQAFLPFIVSQS